MLDLFGVALDRLGHLAHRLLEGLDGVIQVTFAAISHILHHVELLLEVSDFFVGRFALLQLLVLHFKVDLL